MELRHIHAYNLIRVLRAVIPLAVIVLAAIPAWNYLERRASSTTDAEPSTGLVPDVREVTEDVRYGRREDGETVFSVDAARNRALADGRRVLEDVGITFPAPDPSNPDQRMDCDSSTVEEASGDITCRGGVEFHWDEETVVRTTAIRYEDATRTITSLGSARIVRPGKFLVDAEQLSLHLAEDLLEVGGGVRVTTPGGVTLAVNGARYYRAAHRIELMGSVRLRSPRGEVRSRLAEIALDPVTLDPREIAFDGSVSATGDDRPNPVRAEADAMRVALSDGRMVEAAGWGSVRAETSDAGGRRVLFAEEMSGAFSPAGTLVGIDASGEARMLFGGGYELRSRDIVHEFEDATLRSGDASTLDLGDVRIEGRQFVVSEGATIEFSTDRAAVIASPSGVLRAPRTAASFDPETGALSRLSQSGGAVFTGDGMEGYAERIAVEPEGWISLTGSAGASLDARLRIDAEEIRLHEDGERFAASGAVRAILSDSDAPVLVEGGRAEGGGSLLTFHESPELWREDMHVTATRSIEFHVDERRLAADGDIVSTFGDVRARADRMDFDEFLGRLLFTGTVRARFPDADLDADRVEFHLDAGEPVRVLASEQVEVRSADLVGAGDRVDYEASRRTITLTGANATVRGPETGLATGPRFVWNVEDDRVVMMGDDQRRPVSRRRVDAGR